MSCGVENAAHPRRVAREAALPAPHATHQLCVGRRMGIERGGRVRMWLNSAEAQPKGYCTNSMHRESYPDSTPSPNSRRRGGRGGDRSTGPRSAVPRWRCGDRDTVEHRTGVSSAFLTRTLEKIGYCLYVGLDTAVQL